MARTRRLDVNGSDWQLIDEVAKILKAKPDTVIRILFEEIHAALAKGNTTVRLPSCWVTAATNLLQQGAAAELENSGINLSILQTSRKTNSGYEGVYAHSIPERGFIARGREPGTNKPGHHIGLYKTAEHAAWARYEHYRKHGMPYGALEAKMDFLRNQQVNRKTPEHWLRALAINELAVAGVILPDLDAAERKWETTNPIPEMDC